MPPAGDPFRLATPEDRLADPEARLVDVLDRLLDRGIVLRGEVWLTVAGIDLVFLGIDAFLANPDTIARGKS